VTEGNCADIFIYVKCMFIENITLLSILLSCGAGMFVSFPFPLDITVKNVSTVELTPKIMFCLPEIAVPLSLPSTF
jgi:hypothetical protein